MDDHHYHLEHKFHEDTAASNDQHSLTSIQRQSISVLPNQGPNERHHEQMKQFQREQQQLDIQHQHTHQQQEKLNEKFKIYKRFQQKQEYDQQYQKDIHQFQLQQHQMQQQMHQQMEQEMHQQQQMQDKQKQLASVHGHFGQKMLNDYAKPFYPTEHQHQSILTLQTHLLQDERFKPNKKLIPEFKPIANVRSIPIEHQPLQTTQQLYPVHMDQQIETASSNVEPVVAIEPATDTTDKSGFRINVSESEQLPKPEAFTLDSPYQFQPQTDYNMFQLFQIQPVSPFQPATQSLPGNDS